MAEIRILWDLPNNNGDPLIRGEIHEVADWLAENLVASKYAEYTDPSLAHEYEENDDPDFDAELARLDSAEVDLDSDNDFDADDFDSDFGADENDEPEFESRPKPVKKPRTVDPKSKWLDYARFRGYTGDDTITKNRLIAEYGD